MNKQLRIVLTSLRSAPSRSELSSSERTLGEKFFEGIPLEWAGWIVIEDSFNLSAQWLCPLEHQDDITNRIEHSEFKDHRIGVYVVDDEEAEEALLI